LARDTLRQLRRRERESTLLAAASLSNAPLSVSGPRRHARAFAMAEGSKPRLKEAFALFDKDGDGYINHEELVTVMRSLGFNPTPAEVRDLISEGTSGQYTARGGRIDFELFCSLMNRKVKDDDTEAELKDAFRVLDKVGQGYVGVEEMRRICKQLGEDLTAEEVTDMISEAISNFEGKVYYDGFVKTLVTKS
jgi:calmodulin